MTAEERGMEMFQTSTGKLPPMAVGFVRFLCQKYGGCGEVMLTGFTAYAQAIEGLPCTDDLYTIDAEGKNWFAENKNKKWRWKKVTVNDKIRIQPVCD